MEFVDTSIVEQIEIKMIRPSQYAVRDKIQKGSEETETLSLSIREHGLLQPILIRPLEHGFEIVAGHRRFQACRSLRWRFVPCKIREMSDKQAFEIQLTENIQRKSMDPVEEAEAFRRYVVEFGWGGVSELARKVGKSEEYVSHRLQLLKLPDSVKEQIAQNRLNVSQAIELTTLSSSNQAELMTQVINENLTVREIREIKMALIRPDRGYAETLSDTHLSYSEPCMPKPAKIAKKTALTLRVTLTRLDNLIEEVRSTVEPNDRAEVVSMLMGMRKQIHSMIDEAIRFRNSSQRSAK
ncbi:MAG TPA: ParB/RepB/Spo0J family partition protein [Nitrososphaera sp.]|nr:ParB/RepB/Spo0J family partition protein [Nitrososphaera sp.]